MKSAMLAALLAGACTTAQVAGARPFDDLRGCWIERRGEETLTMRWFPDRVRAGVWRGDLLRYTPGQAPAAQTFLLEQDSMVLCPQDEPHGPPCKPVFFDGSGPADEDQDWFSVQADAQSLRFDYVIGLDSMLLFNGASDGCD